MMRILTIFTIYAIFSVCLLFRVTLAQLDEEEAEERARRFAELMKHDGVERVVTLNSQNFNSITSKHRAVVLFHAQTKKKDLKQHKHLLEVVAKVYDGKDIVFGVCNVLTYQELAQKSGVKFVGVIKIFNFGKISDYLGQRSADVMVPYLSKLFERPVVEISSKTRKKQFDSVDLPKVVAYVKRDSKESSLVESAARAFQPMIPFYVVHENKFAKSFQLKKLNSLKLIKPHEKPIAFSSKLPFDEDNIIKFVNENKREIMRKLRLENLHGIWAADQKGYLIPVFARSSGQDGPRFISIAKKVARSFSSNELLNFVWIDPEPFPAMREHWRQTFNIDPMEPSIGAVDVSKQTSAWFQVPSSSKKHELTEKDIKQWIRKILSGDIQLVPMKQSKETTTDEAAEKEGRNEKEEL